MLTACHRGKVVIVNVEWVIIVFVMGSVLH